jgi:uncharacterized protein (DUF2141 family)
MRTVRFGLALACAAGFIAADVAAQQGNTINIVVSGLRNNNGDVRCGLYNSAAAFPNDGKQFMGVAAPIANQQATCAFNNVPPGTYAAAVFHAEKGETKMRTGFFGQPEEGYGFSRNATGTMGPPSFNAAAYAYAGGTANFPITITYP